VERQFEDRCECGSKIARGSAVVEHLAGDFENAGLSGKGEAVEAGEEIAQQAEFCDFGGKVEEEVAGLPADGAAGITQRGKRG
jgi:hypothetical protein